jgi:cobalt-zinc-cadmium efflux system outer membrane protein
MVRTFTVAWTVAAVAGLSGTAGSVERGSEAAAAEAPSGGPPACSGPLDARAVVRCAVESSPEIREARQQLASIAGRRLAARVWLPSNPVLSATAARRSGGEAPGADGRTVLNWSATVSQEIEIAGQRGARLDVVDAEAAAQVRRVAVAEQEVAARALAAHFEALAAQEALRFAQQLVETSQALADAAEGRAREALLAGVDADVARAEATRIGLARFQAERRWSVARASLTLLVGATAEVDTVGRLPAGGLPAPRATASLTENALRLRGEVAAAEMERRVLERQLALHRRERIPAVTFSAFAQRDGFAERVLGGGVSIPLPLPGPMGRSREGEIAETIARIRAAESSVELVRRRVRLEVAQALASFTATRSALALFKGDLIERAPRDLAALREALSSRQLSLRDALVAQRSLLELLASHIEARLAHVEAWIELRRAAGLPLTPDEGGLP